MLGCEDDSSRKYAILKIIVIIRDWIKRLSSLLVLRMASSNSIYTDEDFKKYSVFSL